MRPEDCAQIPIGMHDYTEFRVIDGYGMCCIPNTIMNCAN